MNIRERIKDWWRGYSTTDVISLCKKMNDPLKNRPGNFLKLTQREFNARKDLEHSYTPKEGLVVRIPNA
jgi:hypothetical protein